MENISFSTLWNVPKETIRHTLNTAFADYIIPFQLDEEQFERKLYVEDIDLDISAGAFDGDQLVGFILHGKREKDGQTVVYNGATGVVPSHRGNHLTEKMYAFIIDLLKAGNVDQLLLEVIEGNEPAFRAYDRMGFEQQRYLKTYKGAVPEYQHSFDIRELPNPDRTYLETFWDIYPSWQNDTCVLQKPQSGVTLGAYDGNLLVGYLHFNYASRRIMQLGVSPGHRRRGVGRALMSHLKLYADEAVIINIDHTSEPTLAFFEAMGWSNYVNLFEMSRPM